MSETAPAYGHARMNDQADPLDTSKPLFMGQGPDQPLAIKARFGRMRGATIHACILALEYIDQGAPYEGALKSAGISRRSLDRYVKAMGHAAPEKAFDGRQQPAPLPLFDQEARLVQLEASLRKCDEFLGEIDRRMARAAELLNDAAHVLANWPKP